MASAWKCNGRVGLSNEEFRSRLHTYLAKLYPKTLAELGDPSWELVTSPYVLRLPLLYRAQATEFIETVYELSRQDDYQAAYLTGDFEQYQNIKNTSVLMAYDFHIDERKQLRLIEINTNASGFLLADLVNRVQNPQIHDLIRSSLQESFIKEWQTAKGTTFKPAKVRIADENVSEQKMFYEFHLFREWMRSWNWETEICELKDAAGADFIYNRSTDFFLQKPEHRPILEAWLSGQTVVSPNPKEYRLLADKNRLLDFAQKWFPNSPRLRSMLRYLIPSEPLARDRAEEFWARRKNLFFKPVQSHGAKGVYRGEGISRKKFEEILSSPMLAQEFVPAPEMSFGEQNWKFDLRFYVYENQIQYSVARLYRGQVTNFAHVGGGFAALEWE